MLENSLKSVKITNFAKRHFDKSFIGTKILNMSVEKFEQQLHTFRNSELFVGTNDFILKDGYAPFCKIVWLENFTDATVGSLEITMENYQYLRSGYSARTEKELPVLSRWFELPLPAPKAEYLMLVLYSKTQLDKEGRITEGEYDDPNEKYIPFDAKWGVVAILALNSSEEEPMKPETAMRNALGIDEGGSGVKLNREKYLESVEFWSKHATVK